MDPAPKITSREAKLLIENPILANLANMTRLRRAKADLHTIRTKI